MYKNINGPKTVPCGTSGETFKFFDVSLSPQQPLLLQIKTHGSESRGQEEAGLRDEPVSYLQVAPLWNLLTL